MCVRVHVCEGTRMCVYGWACSGYAREDGHMVVLGRGIKATTCDVQLTCCLSCWKSLLHPTIIPSYQYSVSTCTCTPHALSIHPPHVPAPGHPLQLVASPTSDRPHLPPPVLPLPSPWRPRLRVQRPRASLAHDMTRHERGAPGAQAGRG